MVAYSDGNVTSLSSDKTMSGFKTMKERCDTAESQSYERHHDTSIVCCGKAACVKALARRSKCGIGCKKPEASRGKRKRRKYELSMMQEVQILDFYRVGRDDLLITGSDKWQQRPVMKLEFAFGQAESLEIHNT
jgi:hypothetical protein